LCGCSGMQCYWDLRMNGRMRDMEMKFCPRLVGNSEAKDNAQALSGGKVEA